MKLSQYAGGARISGVYNASNKCLDIPKCLLGAGGFYSPEVEHIKQQWFSFIVTHEPDAKFFQTCHSGGATHVKNALLSVSEWVQQRIIVLAIAPASIIPKKLCYQSDNYASKNEIVHYFNPANIKYWNELHILEPHPNAGWVDHDFESPTFAPALQLHISNYLEKYGDKR